MKSPRSSVLLVATLSASWLGLPATALGGYSEAEFQEDFEETFRSKWIDCTEFPPLQSFGQPEDVDDCVYDSAAAKDCVDALEASTCDQFFDGVPFPCYDVYTDCDEDDYAEDEEYDVLGDVSAGVTGQRETLRDEIDGDVSKEPTPNSDESKGSQEGAGDHTETKATAAVDAPVPEDAVQNAFGNTYFPCGPGPFGFTLCADAGAIWMGGRYVIVAHVLEADVPLADPINLYQYGFVFDADGDPNNNYVPAPPFTADFFRDTDRWYEVGYDPAGGWTIKATDARNGGFSAHSSTARAIIAANTITLVVPREEFSASDLRYRVTAFRHTGDFGQNPPFDWNGDVEPPVGQPLKGVPELSEIPADRGRERDRGADGGGGSGGGGPTAQSGGGGGCIIGPTAASGGTWVFGWVLIPVLIGLRATKA